MSSQSTTSVRQTKVALRETIVIDSDGEDAGPRRKNGIKGTGLSPGADFQSHSVRSTLSHPQGKTAPNVHAEASSNNLSHDVHRPFPTSSNGHSRIMFGVSAPSSERSSTRRQLPQKSQTDSFPRECLSVMGDSDIVPEPLVKLSIGEWVVEDDELVAPEVWNGSSRIEDELSDEQRLCPVCGIDLRGVLIPEAETHVNQCLDTMTLQNDNAMQNCTSIAESVKPDSTPNKDGLNIPSEGRGDLYTMLMNSHKNNESWVEADTNFRSTRGNRRKAPFYKVLQGMPIAVDAFCYGTIPGVTAYFLTHAHSDHYTNLGSGWKNGPIYCSDETANLIIHMLAVDPRWIHPLPLDTPTVVPNTGGVCVTLIEANHCPGSCLFFFEGQQTVDAGDSIFKSPFVGSARIFRYLHCGDFRASPRHVLHSALKGKYIDHIYLDTTYLDPKFTFSPQPLVISACAELARRLAVRVEAHEDSHTNKKITIDAWVKTSVPAGDVGQQILQERILVIVGTYSIGKERIVKAIAAALGTKIYCDPRKTAILRCQADKDLHALLTADPIEASVHILPLGVVTSDSLRSYLQRFKGRFSRVIGFRPTGWNYTPPAGSDLNGSIQSIISLGQSRHFSYTDLQASPKSSYNIQIFGVPYSEHSSFFELTCFAMSCDWGKIIPTVNVANPTSRAKMTKWLQRWELEKRRAKATLVPPRTVDYW